MNQSFKLSQFGGTATALIVKMKLGTKLLLSNLILIFTVLAVTAISFHYLSSQYLLREAKQQMKEDAQLIVQSLKSVQLLSERDIMNRAVLWNGLRLAGHRVDSKIILYGQGKQILYSNANARELQQLRLLDKQDNANYVTVKQLIQDEEGTVRGRLILAARIKDVNGINQMLVGALLVSIIIGGIVALIMGYWLGRSLSRPIQVLSMGMKLYSPKRQLPDLNIHTKDEISELADSFIHMAKRLRANDQLQIDFIQNASHELKTPLMAIQGNAEAIKDGIVKQHEAEESLDVIIEECQRLKGIVDELIYLTKLDNADESFKLEVVAIGPIIEEAIHSIRGLAAQKGIDVTISGETDILGEYDVDKLKRAFVNIMGNGIRYARSSIALSVDRYNEMLEINYKDDGQGFAPDEEQRVFDRFYKGENGGSGIGLAITRTIIEAHGGSIEARQGQPTGAEFRIKLPYSI